jgi:murein L,D-transpeptidase YcbB/YkuD
MGRVKYMFDNKYAVFMHDTIGTWRFKIPKEKIRFVSHGCVRLEHPLATMKHISTYYTKRSYRSVRKQYNNHEMVTVNLSKKLPIHISYLTSYIDSKGRVRFYKDIYNYDKLQELNFKL